jgi:uncharacterized membrane protein YjjP (DUF1212 family)
MTNVANAQSPSVEQIGKFLAGYGSYLFGCGATCIRLIKNMKRIAEAWGVQLDTIIIPTSITVNVKSLDGSQSYMSVSKVQHCGLSFAMNTSLSRLSWRIADEKLSLDQATEIFNDVVTRPHINRWVVLLLASLANASFCRLFGGDITAMLVIFTSTLLGFFVRQELMHLKVDFRFVVLICAMISSIVAAGATLFRWGTTPEIAMATSVLYLVPGIPYINSVSDMLDGHYLCAFGRLMNAVILTCCLSAGLCGGLLLMGLKLF